MRILVCALLCGCSGSGGGGGSAASSVEGTDFSGTYILGNVQCYNSGLTAMTNSATYSNASSTVVISGNSLTETSIAGTCSVVTTGRIVLNDNGMTLSSMAVQSATSGGCSQTKTLNGSTITPTSITTAYSTGQALAGVTNAVYAWNATTKAFGFLSTYSDGAGGYCFVVFTKQ